jgi:hypothetical protein
VGANWLVRHPSEFVFNTNWWMGRESILVSCCANQATCQRMWYWSEDAKDEFAEGQTELEDMSKPGLKIAEDMQEVAMETQTVLLS